MSGARTGLVNSRSVEVVSDQKIIKIDGFLRRAKDYCGTIARLQVVCWRAIEYQPEEHSEPSKAADQLRAIDSNG